MKLFKKVAYLATIAAVLLTQGCATMDLVAKQGVTKTPPREAYVMLTKEVIYEFCYNYHKMYDDVVKKHPNAIKFYAVKKEDMDEIQCHMFEGNNSMASGVHIKKFTNPNNEQKRSLLLTAGHFCEEPGNKVPNGVLPPEFEFQMPKLDPYLERAKVYWKFEVRDFLGNSIGAAKLIASTMEEDLCLLDSQRINHEPVGIAKKGLMYGEKVANISTPYGLFFPPNILIDEGYYIGSTSEGAIMMSDMSIGPGSSGSMILVHRWGEWKLVGMIHSVILVKRPPVGSRHLNIGEPMVTLGASLEQITEYIKNTFKEFYLK